MSGQLSIFSALIFQTLFVLFAMSLNIALVVHDKINLQNSVDLAAYYGAMKQAQLLNVIAHINYQIRQSWKLMVWRQRVLGATAITPHGKTVSGFPLEPFIQAKDEALIPHSFDSAPPPSNGAYSTCVAHSGIWRAYVSGTITSGQNDDNLCTKMTTSFQGLAVPQLSGLLGSLTSFFNNITNNVIAANITVGNNCTLYGLNSWLLSFHSTAFFIQDQDARKHLIYKIAQDIMARGLDLEGKPINIGAKQTLEKNLSYINKTYLNNNIQYFNSLEGQAPNQWLQDQALPVTPLYSSFEGNDKNRQGACQHRIKPLTEPHSKICRGNQIDNCPSNIKPFLKKLQIRPPSDQDFTCDNPTKCSLSAGLKKNPHFIVFYSVKAEVDYKGQIFLPPGQGIKLKAQAYAKPFGGRIGPDNSVDPRLPDWPPNSYQNQAPPPRVYDQKHTPNYSRYPFDPHGLRSHDVHYFWTKLLNAPQVKQYKDLNYYSLPPMTEDILAAPPPPNSQQNDIPARWWELAAISPDLFDITYFTILPYYMEVYFHKVENLFQGQNITIKGDLGHDRNHPTRNHYISYQITKVWQQIQSLLPTNFPKPFYKVKKLEHILTGWNPPIKKYHSQRTQDEYNKRLDDHTFGKCHFLEGNPQGWGSANKLIAGGCIYGGRTGYSVKMISPCIFKTALPVPQGLSTWLGNSLDQCQ